VVRCPLPALNYWNVHLAVAVYIPHLVSLSASAIFTKVLQIGDIL